MTVGEGVLGLPGGRGDIACRHWHGDAAGLPVLAVHGWLDNAATFDACLPHLQGHPVWAIDLPGHGWSSHRPPGMRYHNADYLDDLLAVMDQIAPGQPLILLGHSLGAGLLMLLAGIVPERVHRLVLIDGLGPLAADPAHYAEQTREALLAWSAFEPALRPVAAFEAAVQARRQGVAGPLSEPAARALASRSLRQGADGQWYWSSDKRLRLPSLMRFSEAQVLSCIAAITAPTLLIQGEDSPLFAAASSAHYQARLAAFASLQTLTLPGGHHLHLAECPQPVARAIQGFLDS